MTGSTSGSPVSRTWLPIACHRRQRPDLCSSLGPPAVFRRCKKDEHRQVLDNVVKTMLDPCADADDGSGAHGSVFLTDTDLCATRDHVVNLVFRMRLLRISASRRQFIDAHAQKV